MIRNMMPTLLFMAILIGTCNSCASAQTARSSEGVEIKSKAAPAIVRIETGKGFGTGFFFRPDGWLLTNYHVVKDAPVDLQTGRSFVRITYGELDSNGQMLEQERPLWASIYRLDRRADLALLLLDEMPEGKVIVPFIPIAANAPKDGETCFAVGMPIAGMKWDLRDGKVSSQGMYPDNVAIELDKNLQQSPQRREQLLRSLAPEGSVRMIVTTCGINPGDSGGPILNSDGALIAVTKAIPKSTLEGISLDKISYHIHLSEVSKFVESLPIRPELLPPYSMPRNAQMVKIPSKKTQALIYELENPTERMVATYIDLDQSSAKLLENQDQSILELSESEFWKQLGIEWAILKDSNKPTVHYFDLDQNGEFEIVYQNAMDEGDQPKCFRRQDSKWQLEISDRDFLTRVEFAKTSSQDIFTILRNELPPRYTR